MADPGGFVVVPSPQSGHNSFIFAYIFAFVFTEKQPRRRLALPPTNGVDAPHRKSWICPCNKFFLKCLLFLPYNTYTFVVLCLNDDFFVVSEIRSAHAGVLQLLWYFNCKLPPSFLVFTLVIFYTHNSLATPSKSECKSDVFFAFCSNVYRKK